MAKKPQEVAKTTGKNFMWEQRRALEAISRDPEVVDRLIIIVIREMKINPKLAECTKDSIIAGALEAAKFGVDIGGSLAQAYLIPRGGKAVFQLAWRGLVKLMKDGNPEIEDVFPILIRKGDDYNLDENNIRRMQHTFDPMDPEREKQPVIGGYCRVTMRDQSYRDYVMTRKKIDDRKKCAQTKDIWNKWPDEMDEKTLVRHAAGKVDLSPEVRDKITRMDKNETVIEIEATGTGNKAVRELLASRKIVAPAAEDEIPEAEREVLEEVIAGEEKADAG